jgi:hypothetical protein
VNVPQEVPDPNLGIRLLSNFAAGQMMVHLSHLTPEQVAQWVRDDTDAVSLTPDRLDLPRLPFARPAALAAARAMTTEAWHYILLVVDRAAGPVCEAEARRAGTAQAAAEAPVVARRLRTIAALLRDRRAFPWYCRQMEAFRSRILRQLGAER